jgi:L,D-transpeptidase catalytic domain
LIDNDRAESKTLRRLVAVSVAVVLGAVALPAAGASRAPILSIPWVAPSPADGQSYSVAAGTPIAVTLSAGPTAGISVRSVPAGASLAPQAADPSASVFTWTPKAAQTGTWPIVFVAKDRTRPGKFSLPRTIFVEVLPASSSAPLLLTGSGNLSRWAYVYREAVVRKRPTVGSPMVTRLPTMTPEGTDNIVLALAQATDERGRKWVKIRLAILPNNSTGWIQRDVLGSYIAVRKHLVIDRATFSATLYGRGIPLFRTRVGVGKPYWPTPRGEYYVRVMLTGYADPFYGPVAFGTSARSAVLTDWPGGGYIGIHGTSLPWLLPGRVSHGCVRIKNAAILRLARLMGPGTPVSIR